MNWGKAACVMSSAGLSYSTHAFTANDHESFFLNKRCNLWQNASKIGLGLTLAQQLCTPVWLKAWILQASSRLLGGNQILFRKLP